MECYAFTRGEIFLLVIAIGVEVASAVCLSINIFKCAGQCFLFGRVMERERVLESGSIGWCIVPIFINSIAVSSSLFLLGFFKLLKFRCTIIQTQRKASYVLVITTLLTFLAACIISQGFKVWCSSMVINSCSKEHVNMMDWRQFKPKYMRGYDSYSLLLASEICSWCTFALWFVLCITHVLRLFMATGKLSKARNYGDYSVPHFREKIDSWKS